MKQVQVTDAIRAKLKAAAGDSVDVDNLAVFRAVALNTLPIRQNHPLYKDARHSRQFLSEMASFLQGESIPLQVMHSQKGLPLGRVFSGEVVDQAGHSELQVLFWVDKNFEQEIGLINNGTVDQVSVSVLAKQAISNKSGFDFFGPEADLEHIWSGTDPDGNTMGQNGSYVLLQGLNYWYEMSLVGQGGARGARILHDNDIRLAASGQTVPPMTLTVIPSSQPKETSTMDLTALVEQLTSAKADLAVKTAELTQAKTQVEQLQAQIADLQAQLKPDLEQKLAAAEGQVATLSSALRDATQQVFTLTGNPTADLPTNPAELASTLVEKVKTIKLPLSNTTRSADAGTGARGGVPQSNAFRRR